MSSSSNDVGRMNGELRYIPKRCKCGKKASVRIVDSNKPSKGRLYFVCDECEFWAWCLPSTTNSSGIVSGPNEDNDRMGTLVSGTKYKCSCELNNIPSRMIVVESNVKMIIVVGLVLYCMSVMMYFISNK